MAPDSEVVTKGERRWFAAAEKLRVLREVSRCTKPGEQGALRRREGLYSSHVSEWRRAGQHGELIGARGERTTTRGSALAAGAVAAAIVFGCVLADAVAAQGTARSLDIPPGARENALGHAGVAVVGDPSDALWWNPAALGFAEWYSAQHTRARLARGLASDVQYRHVAAGVPVGGRFGLGVSGTFLSYGILESPGGFFVPEPRERSWALAAGYRVLPNLAAGLTVKYVRLEDFYGAGSEESAAGFDFGGLFRKTLAPVTIGAGVNVQNIGPEMQFPSGASAPLGRNLKIGGAASVRASPGAGSFEAGATLLVDLNQSLPPCQHA